ncbi:MAG TPA: cyclic nucleotide-binding domain-containing protein [Thermoanaerobaculia bacterium]|nr:cyclic nucleotide-binding domain-containing protein [Thermoanaerobaculia bacterium]HQR68321.1 cyclic nucleotide-binding domain-containing protein [Thermoanaerobaculia bacterium]
MKVVLKSGSVPGFEDFVGRAAAGKEIFLEGDVGTEMYVIQSGSVELVKKTRRGDEKVLATLEKGDFFGEMSILEAVPRTATARAKTDCEFIRINQSTFDEMLRHNTEIAVRMLRKLSRRLRETTKLLEETTGMAPSVDEATDVSAPSSSARHRTHRLVGEAGEEFFLSSEEETTIGRIDPVTGIRPDVDLATLDTQRSVSRRHSKITRSGTTFFVVEEIGTMNGTFVNGVRIQTGQPVTIKDGDRLRFGLVDLTFKAKRS